MREIVLPTFIYETPDGVFDITASFSQGSANPGLQILNCWCSSSPEEFGNVALGVEFFAAAVLAHIADFAVNISFAPAAVVHSPD